MAIDLGDGAVRQGTVPGPPGTPVRIEFGRRWLGSDEAARLRVGSVVAFDVAAAADVAVYAGGRLVAGGEPVLVEGKLGVRIRRTVVPEPQRDDA